MATATKCDRCQKYVDRLPESCPFIMHKKDANSATSVRYTMNLCPGCYESFLNWANMFDKVETVMVDRETDDE